MTSTSLDPQIGRLLRAARAPVLIGVLVLLVALGIAVSTDRQAHGLLDPTAVDGSGSRALAELLRGQGVDVRVARKAAEIRAAGPDTTVLVPFPESLAPDQRAAATASTADLVVVAAGAGPLAPGVTVGGHATVASREPGCSLAAARAAGTADLGGVLYRTQARGAVRCYAERDGAALVVVPEGKRTVTLVGASDMFTNDALATNGNAALASRLLGEHRRLLWYLPAPETMAGPGRPLVDLVPRGWLWGAVQLAVGVLFVALWRARRLGPVVAEPLPVVVRAAETVEGRGRLYRKAGARGHAAQALREAARHRLRRLLGMSANASPTAVVDAVAARSGRQGAEVGELLYGAAPMDDAGLVRLADGLDALDREVRRP